MKAKAIKIAAALAVLGLSTFMARWLGRADACCGVYLYVLSFADTPDPFAPERDDTSRIDGTIMEESFVGVVYTPEVDIEVSDVTLSATVTFVNQDGYTTWWYFSAVWDGKNSSGELVPGGTYTYTVTATTPDMGYDSAVGTITVEEVQLEFDCRDVDGGEDGGWTPTTSVVVLAADGEKIEIRARATLGGEPWGEPNMKVSFEVFVLDIIMVNGTWQAFESLDADGESAAVTVEWMQGPSTAYLRAVLWDPDELEEIGEAAYLPVAGEMAEITLTADPPVICAVVDEPVTFTATVTRPTNATFRPGPEGHVENSNLKILFVSGDTNILTLSGGAQKEESIDSATGEATTQGKATGNPGTVTVTARPHDPDALAAADAEFELTVVLIEIMGFWPNETYALGNGCPPINHAALCMVDVVPPETEIAFDILPPWHGAMINQDGVIMPASDYSGLIMVRVWAVAAPLCMDEAPFLIKAHPTDRDSSVVAEGSTEWPFRYGGRWWHTFNSTGGSLEGVTISEEIVAIEDPQDRITEWIYGQQTWQLDAGGEMTTPDLYFMPHRAVTPGVRYIARQWYAWHCPMGNAWREFIGPNHIQWGPPVEQVDGDYTVDTMTDYHAPGEPSHYFVAKISSVDFDPPKIPVGGRFSTGSATVFPDVRELTWAVEGTPPRGAAFNDTTRVWTSGSASGLGEVMVTDTEYDWNRLRGWAVIVDVVSVGISPVSIPADGTSVAAVQAIVSPIGEKVEWSFPDGLRGCTWSALPRNRGKITAGKQTGSVTVKATAVGVVPAESAQATLKLTAP